MRKIKRIIKKLEKIEKLLAEIKLDMENMNNCKPSASRKTRLTKKAFEEIPDNELRSQYEELYKEYEQGKVNVVEEFVKHKTKRYLSAFCKANNLPINATKLSKTKIFEELVNWMAQRKAITQKVK